MYIFNNPHKSTKSIIKLQVGTLVCMVYLIGWTDAVSGLIQLNIHKEHN